MRLECEVLSVTGNGEQITVTLQGARPDAASWRNYGQQTLTLDDNASTRKAYYIGRKVILNIDTR